MTFLRMLRSTSARTTFIAAALSAPAFFCSAAHAQTPRPAGPPDFPSVTSDGVTITPKGILARNMGTAADQETAFPPHRIIANIYYVGTRTLSTFLIVTPQGNILIDSTYERNVPVILKSVEQLGFKFSDTKILLGNHAHGDHMEGDALVKQLTGASVEAMSEDLPALRAIKPGGKEHPVDRVLHDGDTISLGGTTLTAILTPGHTHGCTTFTTTVSDHGKDYHVVFGCSLRSPGVITPDVEAELKHSFEIWPRIPCDVPLGDHPAQVGLTEKYARIKPGAPNPYIDKAGCTREMKLEEAMFHAVMAEQAKTNQQAQ
jgi:metallo-beta-lactamase class B